MRLGKGRRETSNKEADAAASLPKHKDALGRDDAATSSSIKREYAFSYSTSD